MLNAELFKGIAVVIDDEVGVGESGIGQIQAKIKAEGCHVIALDKPPSDEQISALSGISFFVVDWNLDGPAAATTEERVQLPERLKKESVAKTIKLLKDLKSKRVAPIFIFTAETDLTEVEAELKLHKELYSDDDPSHILVKSKSDVLKEGVFAVLVAWLGNSPSAYFLRYWEKAYEQAKQEFFLDFYAKNVSWPLILWKTFVEDGVSPSDEIGRLIGKNLLSRMTPFEFDIAPFESLSAGLASDSAAYKAVVLKVLEGERYISQVPPDSIAPGDIYKDGKEFYINIRPDCDCVPRSGGTLDDVELYLLLGSKVTGQQLTAKFNQTYGNISEPDNQSIIYPIADGKGIAFNFNSISIKTYGSIRDKRVGRLLTPYLTRLQERLSMYLQRPGLTRYPSIAFDPIVKKPELKQSSDTTVKEQPIEAAVLATEAIAGKN